MLKTRIIPTLLWKNVGLVKGVRFDSWRRIGTVLPAIRVYNTRAVDELILVDISATQEDRAPDTESIRDLATECFMPMTIGGGIRTIEHIRDLLLAGADKVAINSALFDNPEIVRQGAQRFGSQCIVASLDARRHSDGRYECFKWSGTRPTGQDPITMARQLEESGAGEILLTSIDQDGTMEGYDLDLIQEMSSVLTIPVIASGGAGSYEDFLKALKSGASAVAAASMFHFTEQTPLDAKRYLAKNGVPVRLPVTEVQSESASRL